MTYQCKLCGERLLRWGWYESPGEPVWYGYCLSCDKAEREPCVQVHKKENGLLDTESYDQYCMQLNKARFTKAFNCAAMIVNRIAIDHGWWDEGREDGTIMALIHSEVSEGLEALREDKDSDKIKGFKGIEEELADAIIRIMDFSCQKDLRVGEALVAKVKYNMNRPYKHGGKRF